MAKRPLEDRSAGPALPDAKPSKWRKPEFFFYYFCFLTIVPLMFKAVYDVSKPGAPGYERYSKLLSPGWIPGRQVDNSDGINWTGRDSIRIFLESSGGRCRHVVITIIL